MAKQTLYTVTDSANPNKPYLTKVPLDTVAINMNITEEEAQVAVNTGKLLYDQYRIIPAGGTGGSSKGLVILLAIVIIGIVAALAVLLLRGKDNQGNADATQTPTPTPIESTEDPFGEDFMFPDEPSTTPEPTVEPTTEPESTTEPVEEPTTTPEQVEEPTEPEYDWESVDKEEMQEILNDKQFTCNFSVLDCLNFNKREEATLLQFEHYSRSIICDIEIFPIVDDSIDYEHVLYSHSDIKYQTRVNDITIAKELQDFLPLGPSNVMMRVSCKDKTSGDVVGYFYVNMIFNILAD